MSGGDIVAIQQEKKTVNAFLQSRFTLICFKLLFSWNTSLYTSPIKPCLAQASTG